MAKKRAMLTEGPIGKILIRLSVPMAIALFGRVAFNLVDTFFVGRLGTLELAAMGFTFPVVLFVTSIALGLGVGASSTVSRAIGEKNPEKTRRLATDSLTLSFAIVVILSAVGLVTIVPLFRLLGANDEIVPLIKEYMTIWYIGVPVVVIPMVGNNAIRATGDTKTPMMIMLLSVVINIILDPLLIFGLGPFPRMELAGAAIATVVARVFSLVVSLAILIRREKMISFRGETFKSMIASWKIVGFIGLPAALTNLIVPVSMGVITRIVSGYGAPAVAGLGVATRIEMFVVMIIGAVASVMIPFVGQNIGGGRIDRVKVAVRYTAGFSMVWSALMFVVFVFASRSVARIFNNDPAVVDTVRLYMIIVSVSYGFFGVMRIGGATLNALHKPLQSAAIALIRMFALYVPLAFLGNALMGIAGVFGGAAAANIAAGIVSFAWVQFEIRKAEKRLSAQKTP